MLCTSQPRAEGTISKSMDESAKIQEETLKSFASLLSSAVTTCGAASFAGSPLTLPRFLSQAEPNTTCVSIPSLSLKNRSSVKNASSGNSNPSGRGHLEEAAALSLAVPLLCTKEDVVGVPATVLHNVLESLDSLINSRLKSSLAALVRQTFHNRKLNVINKNNGISSSDGDAEDMATRQAKIMISLFSSSTKAITITSVVTSFRVLSMDGVHRDTSSSCGDMILPLVLETIVDVQILGQLVTVSLRAPGTITGSFQGSGGVDSNERDLRPHLNAVQVAFDTMSLLRSMMKQARHVVKKAMLTGGAVANLLVSESGKQLLMDPSIPMKDKVSLASSSSRTAGSTRKSEESESMADDNSSNNSTPIDTSGPANDDEDLSSSHFPTSFPLNSAASTRMENEPCPFISCMPPPPPRLPSCGNLTRNASEKMLRRSSSQGLCSLSEAVMLASANASFENLQSQSSGAPTSEGKKSARHKTLANSKLSHNKSGDKRLRTGISPSWSSLSSGLKGPSSSQWEEQQNGEGNANQEWQSHTLAVSPDSLQITPHKKRRILSCPLL
mmetsp:Transcript_21510/g.28292  ORF Transcript_21510/g.28292 Transcript_21510/m.28292 type:complete len:557 (+) Transcript_21510:167-1837(+)